MAKVGEHESHDERKQEVKAGRQQGPTLITVCLSGGGTRERVGDERGPNVGIIASFSMGSE